MIELDRFLAEFESTHGEITEDHIRDAITQARTRAVVVRGASEMWRR